MSDLQSLSRRSFLQGLLSAAAVAQLPPAKIEMMMEVFHSGAVTPDMPPMPQRPALYETLAKSDNINISLVQAAPSHFKKIQFSALPLTGDFVLPDAQGAYLFRLGLKKFSMKDIFDTQIEKKRRPFCPKGDAEI